MGQGLAYDSRRFDGARPHVPPALRTLHEQVAKDFGAALSSLLRTVADV